MESSFAKTFLKNLSKKFNNDSGQPVNAVHDISLKNVIYFMSCLLLVVFLVKSV
jgi:hypothetical protein|eukprot:COSAG01_NODE_330_length_18723_cov_96.763155_10_plen_54_part_00